MTSERAITRRILAELKSRGAWGVKTHGSQYGKSGTPDILACVDGRFVALEVKRPGGKPTRLQEHTLAAIRSAGGIAAVVDSVDGAVELMNPDTTGWEA